MNFDKPQTAAVLAGLRLLQLQMDRIVAAGTNSELGAIKDIWDEDDNGLTEGEIDSLCERINIDGDGDHGEQPRGVSP